MLFPSLLPRVKQPSPAFPILERCTPSSVVFTIPAYGVPHGCCMSHFAGICIDSATADNGEIQVAYPLACLTCGLGDVRWAMAQGRDKENSCVGSLGWAGGAVCVAEWMMMYGAWEEVGWGGCYPISAGRSLETASAGAGCSGSTDNSDPRGSYRG